MYFAHSLVVMTTFLLVLLFNHSVIADNSQAVGYFESALTACDRGMKMRMPRSRGSLRILKSLWNRYQYNRDLALKYDESVKDTTEHFYHGKFLSQKTSFLEAFKLCETDFPNKVKEAETVVTQNIKERELKQQQQAVQRQDLIKNQEAAKREVVLAVNEYCANRLNNPSLPVSSLYENYLAAKQKALSIYPQIVNQIHQATLIDMGTSEETNLSQSIQDWFNYCDTVFARQTDNDSEPVPAISQLSPISMAMVGPEGPTPPNLKSPAATTSPTPPENNPANATKAEPKPAQSRDDITELDFDQEEYQQIVSTSTADRLKVLKNEGRLPDYVNDEDSDYQKANIWQYENEEQNLCNIYKFKENKLVESKNLSGECPSF